MLRLLLVLSVVLLPLWMKAQGHFLRPFVSGVTDHSARFFIWNRDESELTLYISKDSTAWGTARSIKITPASENDYAGISELKDLDADTKYFYKVSGANFETPIQSFRTFPKQDYVGYLNFAFGSCQSFRSLPPQEPVFDVMNRYNPRLFLQCGDWGYPDTTDRYPRDSNFFAISYPRVVETYRARYSGGQIFNVMASTPIDYVYDDHDYVNDNASATSSSIYGENFIEVGFPPIARRNVIDAYSRFFPHYPLPDTAKGIYHSYRLGNAEFFVCDNRAERSPNLNSLKKQGNNVYVFDPPAGHSILGDQQMEWLLNGLKNSSARWKFIVTGVSFNKGYKKVIDAISGNATVQNFSFPGLDFSPKSIFGAVVDTWAGFPQDQDRLINFIKDNNISNVIFLTSDSHTSAMDNGENAGLPEVMAGNLAQTNSRLAWVMANVRTLPLIGNLINADLSAWNGGGQGLGNNNFNNAFGHIEIFGNDSVRCQLIDERGSVFATMTLCDDGKPCKTVSREQLSAQNALLLYPNPAQNILNIEVTEAKRLNASSVIYITDVLGKKLKTITPQSGKNEISVQDLPSGLYYVVMLSEEGHLVKSFTKP